MSWFDGKLTDEELKQTLNALYLRIGVVESALKDNKFNELAHELYVANSQIWNIQNTLFPRKDLLEED